MFLSKEQCAANKDGLFLTPSRHSQRHYEEFNDELARIAFWLEVILSKYTLLLNIQNRFNCQG